MIRVKRERSNFKLEVNKRDKMLQRAETDALDIIDRTTLTETGF